MTTLIQSNHALESPPLFHSPAKMTPAILLKHAIYIWKIKMTLSSHTCHWHLVSREMAEDERSCVQRFGAFALGAEVGVRAGRVEEGDCWKVTSVALSLSKG